MPTQYINYGSFDTWARKIEGRNRELLQRLHDIQTLIKSLEGDWESDASAVIREKIQGMEPRFEDYYNVVDNYVKFIRNTATSARETEHVNRGNAEQFI